MAHSYRCLILSDSGTHAVFKSTPLGLASLLFGSLYVVAKDNGQMVHASWLEKLRLLAVVRQLDRMGASRDAALLRFAAAVAGRGGPRWTAFFGHRRSRSIAMEISGA